MPTRTSKGVNEPSSWIICDPSTLYAIILLKIAAEKLRSICLDEQGINREAKDLLGFLVIRLIMDGMSLEEMKQIVNKITEEPSLNRETEKRKDCYVFGVIPNFP